MKVEAATQQLQQTRAGGYGARQLVARLASWLTWVRGNRHVLRLQSMKEKRAKCGINCKSSRKALNFTSASA